MFEKMVQVDQVIHIPFLWPTSAAMPVDLHPYLNQLAIS